MKLDVKNWRNEGLFEPHPFWITIVRISKNCFCPGFGRINRPRRKPPKIVRQVTRSGFSKAYWIENEQPVNPAAPVIPFTDVDLISGAPGDTDPNAGTIYGFVNYDLPGDKVWLDINLIPKTSGRK